MTLETIAIQMPQSLYQRLERLSQLTQRSLENLVVQTLEAGIPCLPDDLSREMRDMLMALESLDDDTLWQVARGMVDPEQWQQHRQLLEKSKLDALTATERERLALLERKADALMLRKAYAYVLLKWRGYHLPTLAELETQA